MVELHICVFLVPIKKEKLTQRLYCVYTVLKISARFFSSLQQNHAHIKIFLFSCFSHWQKVVNAPQGWDHVCVCVYYFIDALRRGGGWKGFVCAAAGGWMPPPPPPPPLHHWDFYIPTLIIKCWITPRGFFLHHGSHNQIKFYAGLTLALFYNMPCG